MAKANWDKVEDAEGFPPLPEGTYVCQLDKVDDSKDTQNGDEMWHLTWSVIQGPCSGRLIFDNLVFSEAALKRVKLAFSRIAGIKLTGDREVTPQEIAGKCARVTVVIDEYMTKDGDKKKKNVVTFAGYDPVIQPTAPATGPRAAGRVAAPAPAASAAAPAAGGDDTSEENLPF